MARLYPGGKDPEDKRAIRKKRYGRYIDHNEGFNYGVRRNSRTRADNIHIRKDAQISRIQMLIGNCAKRWRELGCNERKCYADTELVPPEPFELCGKKWKKLTGYHLFMYDCLMKKHHCENGNPSSYRLLAPPATAGGITAFPSVIKVFLEDGTLYYQHTFKDFEIVAAPAWPRGYTGKLIFYSKNPLEDYFIQEMNEHRYKALICRKKKKMTSPIAPDIPIRFKIQGLEPNIFNWWYGFYYRTKQNETALNFSEFGVMYHRILYIVALRDGDGAGGTEKVFLYALGRKDYVEHMEIWVNGKKSYLTKHLGERGFYVIANTKTNTAEAGKEEEVRDFINRKAAYAEKIYYWPPPLPENKNAPPASSKSGSFSDCS